MTDQDPDDAFANAFSEAFDSMERGDAGSLSDPTPDPDIEARAYALPQRVGRELAAAGPDGWQRLDAVFALTCRAELVRVVYTDGTRATDIGPSAAVLRLVREQRAPDRDTLTAFIHSCRRDSGLYAAAPSPADQGDLINSYRALTVDLWATPPIPPASTKPSRSTIPAPDVGMSATPPEQPNARRHALRWNAVLTQWPMGQRGAKIPEKGPRSLRSYTRCRVSSPMTC